MTAEFWQYDARLGRRWNVDPRPSVAISVYAAFANNPIFNSDPLGDTTVPTPNGTGMDIGDMQFETFDGSARKIGGMKIQPMKGSLKSFTITGESVDNGAARFIAIFDKKTGEFSEYAWDKNLNYSWGDFVSAATADLANEYANADNIFYQHYNNPEDALKSGIAIATDVVIPSAIIRPLTIASATKKVVNSKVGKAVGDFVKMFKPINEFDVTKTLYRGTTGSENGATVLFLTDNAAVAETYIKQGGQVMKYEMTQFSLKSLISTSQLELKTGMHGVTGAVSTEYMFKGKDLVEAVNSIATPLKN